MEQRDTIGAAILALIVTSAPGTAGRQAREQSPAFRSGVELVTVEVGVVDRQGNPVRGLGPEDFVVTVGDQTRRVVSAEFVDAAAAHARSAVPPDGAVSTNEAAAGGRLFVFVVDQSTIEPGATRELANAASQLLDRLTFADRSAAMFIPVGARVDFTWAHDRVRSALQRATGMSGTGSMWEYGSLAEARDISNRSPLALQTVSQRECGVSVLASGGGGGAGGTGRGGTGQPTGGANPPGGGTAGTGNTGSGLPAGSAAGAGPASAGSGCLREIQLLADSTWRTAQMTSLSSIASLRQLLGTLERVRGDKTVILFSGGWPLDQIEQTSLLSSLADEAAAAQATIFTVLLPRSTFSASRRMVSLTPAVDQHVLTWALEALATMTGGGSFRAEVSARAAFERLSQELSGYYRIGVERDPSDLDGRTRRMKVQVRRSGSTVRARETFDVRTYEDRDWAARMSSALEAPIPATGVGLRLTSYLSAGAEDGARLKLLLTGDATRLQPGEATFQVLIQDLEGNRILSGEQPIGEPTGDRLPFSTSIPIEPGSYIVRLAVMDGTGRVGSVEHRVEARPVPIGPLSVTGPLLVRVPTQGRGEARLALDGPAQDERLALEIGIEGDRAQVAGAGVLFEIAAGAGSPALVQVPGSLSRGPRSGSMIAQAVADTRILPPGEYVARAKVKTGSEELGEVQRVFRLAGIASPTVARAAESPVEPSWRVTSAPHTISALHTVPHFTLDQVLAPAVLGAFLDRVAARPEASSPQVRELLSRAREPGLSRLEVSGTLATDVPVAAFLRGLTLLAGNRLDAAADAFRAAMRGAPDLYPAMVYLGACFAAAGKDKEAAGAWRTALIGEGDSVELHMLASDALLRQGQAGLALATINQARAKWPDRDDLKRRFVVAALAAGEHQQGLDAIDELVSRGAEDEPSLALALMVLYEAFVQTQPVVSLEQDRARVMRYAEAYRARGGPSLALVETWLAAVTSKR
ncbi:MAG TPA: VWA domain-containing protein [Vicinamibacterales bacterium]|nr:VWA domain-containing protein [Vicinamibacterales bacterium]